MTELSIGYEQLHTRIQMVIGAVEKTIIGKRAVIERLLAALLAGGHVLLEDVPGVGKTRLAHALSQAMDLSFKRIQFTPDLMPSDVTGVSIYQQKWGEFEFRHGPIFAHLVLADELNRTSSKTQSALLEAMEEEQVTVDGQTYRLPNPFIVIATQNPIDYEGTSPLPEAQLDRFMLRLSMGYPEPDDELRMLERHGGRLQAADAVKPVMFRDELLQLRRQCKAVHVDESLRRYIVQLVTATRRHPDVELGASPRASLALHALAQASAVISGRSYAVPDDIKPLIHPVLGHRLLLKQEAYIRGQRIDAVLRGIEEQLPVPVPVQRRAAGS